MFRECNVKLAQTRELLVDLIAELDVALQDEREARQEIAKHDGADGDSDYARKLAQQREVLMSVATMLADMRFERSREPQEHEV
ncbi:MAG TPA: hypothetical protein VHU84_14405 [Lacipirellulaceae bacterium]|jgi:hypothetical protein|nr:hypothetical protein [Lacipirellulaceae bacterium]